MTIGMLVESMAGKAGAWNYRFQVRPIADLDGGLLISLFVNNPLQDGSPFQFSETDRAVDFFGQQLAQAGN
jgi:hypothetical protein